MASKRHQRRKGCEGKVRHATRAEAEAERQRLKDHRIEIYACSFCGAFHLGHGGRRYQRTNMKARRQGRSAP